jgi:tetratricopeptide (TPR) repeat protein
MPRLSTAGYIFSILLPGFFFSCATVRYGQDIADYQEDIKQHEASLAENPENATALRELGVIYFETSEYEQALDYLKRSNAIEADDPKTLLYLGMAHEMRIELEDARNIYARYTDIAALSPYRRLLHGRYYRLTRRLIREEIRSLLARETEISAEPPSPQTLAVFPFKAAAENRRTRNPYVTLGLGLSEMLTTDLGHVKQLRLLERVRLQTLLDELAAAKQEDFSQESAPRIGKLLGAGRIVSGGFQVTNEKDLHIDLLSWDVINLDFTEAVTQEDELSNLFRMEKALVFGIIDKMGIEITEEERNSIQRIPTANIQAFMAYCRGLEKEDASDFRGAASFYRQAAGLDADFQEAKDRIEQSESADAAKNSPEDLAASLSKYNAGSPEAALVSTRLEKLNDNLGAYFFPGQDSRKPAEEAEGLGLLSPELSEPPPPPPAQ